MSTLFFDNPRLLILSVMLILVAGGMSFVVLPRMEDPLLTPRAATITTLLPGAEAERVESQVTEKIEQELKEIEEIKEMNSTSRPGVSFIAVELLDRVTKNESTQIWSRIRDKVDDARLELPPEASKPEFKRLDIKAYATILALRWDMESEPRYGVMRRLLKQLKDQIDGLTGTEQSEIFGSPQEEIVVSLDANAATSMNLRSEEISQLITASDSKVAAGQVRGSSDDLSIEVSGELDTLTRLSHIPIRLGSSGSIVELSDIAKIERTTKTPLSAKVLLQDKPAVALGVFVESDTRLDVWMNSVRTVLDSFEQELPPGVSLQVVFEQNTYVSQRMKTLLQNFLYAAAAVFGVICFVMGWRSAFIICLALPLGSLVAIFAMYAFNIPIHQMSITGLIISLGLMVDNAIVVVDEIEKKIRSGVSRRDAVSTSVSYLVAPLGGSTITTILSFGPIALMPGPSGEFVGSIAVVGIIAVAASLLLSLTIIAGLSGLLLNSKQGQRSWLSGGFHLSWLTSVYVWLLTQIYRIPIIGVVATIALSSVGFLALPQLPEQFFPPADRNQFHVELDLPGTGSIAETERVAAEIRSLLLSDPQITRVAWFLGESAPPFYYNVIPSRKNSSGFGQAIVDCKDEGDVRTTIQRVQEKLNRDFPAVSCIAKQLEQGPPFSAPIEAQLFGPDPERLRQLGDQIRLVLSQTPNVIQTRSDFSESIPKVAFAVDEQQARLAGLDHSSIASALNSMLEGVTGGSILEATEELPVRVRVSNAKRGDLNQIVSMDLLTAATLSGQETPSQDYRGVPLSAISTLELKLASGSITRQNGNRMNEIQAYIRSGVLPSLVQEDFEQRLSKSGFELPAGYSLTYAGAEAERNDAIGNLIVNCAILFTLMVATIVIATQSFRLTGLLFMVAGLAVGFGIGAVWLAGLSWGFTAIVGMLGMIGIAVNDSICVMAALKELPANQSRDRRAISVCVSQNTRHVMATTLTTLAGFTPLFLSGGEFWPPIAVSISGGVLGATMLALVFVPSAYLLVYRIQKPSYSTHQEVVNRSTQAVA